MSKKTALRIAVILFVVTALVIGTQVKENLDESHPIVMEVKRQISPVHPEISSMTFRKASKSYTINKEVIYLCIYDENGKPYPMNMLIYVALHEVAHVLCDEVGHTQKFHNIFEDLLKKATEMGIYNPSIPLIQNYCEY